MPKLRKRAATVLPKVAPAPAPKRKARPLEDEAPAATVVSRSAVPRSYQLRQSEVRRQAAQDFITDQENRTVAYWWGRGDRPYRKLVTQRTFESWAHEDNWLVRRSQFWTEIQVRVLESQQHRILQQRLQEVAKLTDSADALAEYLHPIRDEAGHVRRHPAVLENGQPNPMAGLPIFPLEMPPMEKLGKMWVDMHKLLMVKRGEVTSRSESATPQRPGDPDDPVSSALDPTGSAVPFTPSDIEQFSKLWLLQRQPELQSENTDVLDALIERESEQASEDQEALEQEEDEDD